MSARLEGEERRVAVESLRAQAARYKAEALSCPGDLYGLDLTCNALAAWSEQQATRMEQDGVMEEPDEAAQSDLLDYEILTTT